MNAIVIQHHMHETLGSNFESVLTGAGFEVVTVPVFSSAPTFESFDAPHPTRDDIVVSLGGPMSANDGLSALEQEMSYLRQAAEDGIRVIGICLGAQLLARALGGVVEPTGGYQFGLRKKDMGFRLWPRRPCVQQDHNSAGADSAWRVLLDSSRRDGARQRIHAPS